MSKKQTNMQKRELSYEDLKAERDYYKMLADSLIRGKEPPDKAQASNAIQLGVVVKVEELAEIADYCFLEGAKQQLAFNEVELCLIEMERWVIQMANSLPAKQDANKENIAFEHLLGLVEEFTGKASYYHSLLINENPPVHGFTLEPNLEAAALFKEAQSSVMDDLNMVIMEHDRLNDFAQHIASKPLHKRFAKVSIALKRKEKTKRPARLLIGRIASEIGIQPRQAYITGQETYEVIKRLKQEAKTPEERSLYDEACGLIEEHFNKQDRRATMGVKFDTKRFGIFISDTVRDYESQIKLSR